METAWCPTCRRRREVMDTYWTDDEGRTGVVGERLAQPLECGHDAGDGGGEPSQRRPRRDPGLIEQVVRLQEGSRG